MNFNYINHGKPCLFLKFPLIGEVEVGKRTFLKSLDTYNFDENTKLTIGIDFYTYDYPVRIKKGDSFIRFSIWVYEPRLQFKKLFEYYISGSNAICIMFDCSDPSSLKEVDGWLELIK